MVIVEGLILRGDQHLHQQRRHFVQRHQHPVFRMLGMNTADLQRLQACQPITAGLQGPNLTTRQT